MLNNDVVVVFATFIFFKEIWIRKVRGPMACWIV
jgi:hypothetical protein